MIRIVRGLFQFLQLVDFPVKLRQIRLVLGAQGKMADGAVLLPFAFDVDFRAIAHGLLR
jgi:hypothetical protein